MESHKHHYPVSSGLADPPSPNFYQRSAGPSRMSSPESTSDVLLPQMSGKNWRENSGTAGSCSDDQIFNTWQLKRKIEDGRIGFPDPAPVTQGGRDVPYFILADDAFALKTWLMKPYGRRMLTREERIANYTISRGRRVVENAFGILVSRFRVMLTTIELPPATVREVVFACVVLHNILRSQY